MVEALRSERAAPEIARWRRSAMRKGVADRMHGRVFSRLFQVLVRITAVAVSFCRAPPAAAWPNCGDDNQWAKISTRFCAEPAPSLQGDYRRTLT